RIEALHQDRQRHQASRLGETPRHRPAVEMSAPADNMELQIKATNGSRCSHEEHHFRIGSTADHATEFRARSGTMLDHLVDAIIDHRRPDSPLYLQVWCGPSARWRNVRNPATGRGRGHHSNYR